MKIRRGRCAACRYISQDSYQLFLHLKSSFYAACVNEIQIIQIKVKIKVVLYTLLLFGAAYTKVGYKIYV